MKIAVTGASGFIGHELINLLWTTEHEVLALSRRNTDSEYALTNYSIESLSKILQGVDIVIHLAAVRGRDSSLGYEDYRENEVLTENILKAMVKCNVNRFVYLSSISVYSNPYLLPWREDQAVSPCSFYGLSKLTCEYLCNLYNAKGISSIIFRCAHVLGLEHNGYMLSTFLNTAAKKDTLFVRGKSCAKREFIYVKDVARAIVWALTNAEAEGIFNLGTECAYTNLEVAQMINRVFHNENNLVYQDDIPEGIMNSYMNSEKLRKLGFSTQYDLETGILDIQQEKFSERLNREIKNVQ